MVPIRVPTRTCYESVESRSHLLHLSGLSGALRFLDDLDPLANSLQDGGLKCNDNGELEVPFPKEDYCVPGTGALVAKNEASSGVAFCQTVLPGNEAMLIPTSCDSEATLAVPASSYWASTAAQ